MIAYRIIAVDRHDHPVCRRAYAEGADIGAVIIPVDTCIFRGSPRHERRNVLQRIAAQIKEIAVGDPALSAGQFVRPDTFFFIGLDENAVITVTPAYYADIPDSHRTFALHRLVEADVDDVVAVLHHKGRPVDAAGSCAQCELSFAEPLGEL